MSQHCRANPCCGDVPCTGIPLPQHASGYPSYNKNIPMEESPRTSPADRDEIAVALKGLLAIISDSVGVSGYEPDRVTPWDEFPEVAAALAALSAPADTDAALDKPEAVEGEPVAWPIDTDDQVEALARECDWDNRKYMTPKDYAIWCERMRKFASLAALTQEPTHE